MVLTIMERLLLGNLFPPDGRKMAFQKAVRVIRDKVGLTAEELKEYKVQEKDGKVGWDPTLPQEKEIELSNAEIGMISTELKEKDEAKTPELTVDHVSLYEKFVES